MLHVLARKVPFIRHFVVRPRLGISILVGSLLWYFLPEEWRLTTRLLATWDFSMALYLVLAVVMMACSSRASMQKRAEKLDDGQVLILLFTIVTALASLCGIVAELATSKANADGVQWLHVSVAGATVFLSWTFMQTMFALHYAHEYYSDDQDSAQGLEFPGECEDPDYWDFIYFSFIIGTAAQTADVNIKSRAIRRIVTLHCSVVFLFNTTILALTVNIGASLLN